MQEARWMKPDGRKELCRYSQRATDGCGICCGGGEAANGWTRGDCRLPLAFVRSIAAPPHNAAASGA